MHVHACIAVYMCVHACTCVLVCLIHVETGDRVELVGVLPTSLPGGGLVGICKVRLKVPTEEQGNFGQGQEHRCWGQLRGGM